MRKLLTVLVIMMFFSVVAEAVPTPYGTTYDPGTKAYKVGNYVYYYDSTSGLYTTEAYGAGGNLFRVFKPETGQVVVYSGGQPAQTYQSSASGVVPVAPMTPEQYNSFLPHGSDTPPPTAAIPSTVTGAPSVIQTAYGMTYNADTNTYKQGEKVFYYDENSGLYTTPDTGAGVFYALNENKGQVVAYSGGQPVQTYQSSASGVVPGGPITPEQYNDFLPSGSDNPPPTAAHPPAPVAPPAPAPIAAPVMPPVPAPIAAPIMPPVPGSATEPGEEEEFRQITKYQTAPVSATAPVTGPVPIGGNIPQGGVTPAGGVAPAGAPGAQPTTYDYVVGAGGYTDSTGKKWPSGSTLTFNQAVPGLTAITPEQKAFTETYAGQYTYVNGVFSVVKEKPSSDIFADYNTKTTVTLKCEGGICKTTMAQESFVCGEGLSACEKDKDGKKIFKSVPGSKEEVSVLTGTGKDEKGNAVPGVIISKKETVYNDKGEAKAYLQTNYDYKKVDPEDRSHATVITVTGTDGKEYYKYDVAKDTVDKPNGGIDKIPNLSDKEKDAVRVAIVGSGDVGFWSAQKTLTWQQSLGRAIKGYYEYQGIRQFSNMFWTGHEEDVRQRQDDIKRKFCLAAGISNCITSQICEHSYDLQADNIVSGRGPGGQYVASAALNAERTPAIEVAGMTRQQLIDLFGNTTVIGGRLFNLTDPSFSPKILGRIKIRLYHVQYSVRNNAPSETNLTYNIKFVRVEEAYNSSYAAPLVEATWFSSNPPSIAYLSSAKDNLYKFSATEYSDVCLTFKPKLPSGDSLTDKLCVPFQESTTATEAVPPNAIAPPPSGGVPGAAPGGSI